MILYVLFSLALIGSCRSSCIVYVSPHGNDSWSGKLPAPNENGTDGPVQDPSVAFSRCRHFAVPSTVLFRSGTYFLHRPLSIPSFFTLETYPPDFHTSGSATLSGGQLVKNWRQMRNRPGILEANLPPCADSGSLRGGRELFIGYERRILARWPNVLIGDPSRGYSDDHVGHWASVLDPGCTQCPVNRDGVVLNRTDIAPGWPTELPGSFILTFQAWTAEWHVLSSLSVNGTAIFETPSSEPEDRFEKQGGRRFVLVNSQALLDGPGEYFIDESAAVVRYIPLSEAERAAISSTGDGTLPGLLSPTSAVISCSASVVRIHAAQNIVLRNIAIAHSGVADRTKSPSTAALSVTASSDVALHRIHVHSSGTSGIIVGSNSNNVSILDSTVQSVGADGISSDPSVSDLLINNTLVNDTGIIHMVQPAGIRMKGQRSIVVSHCEVSFNSYGGILIGWQRGFPSSGHFPVQPVMTARYNVVHHYGMGILSDFGGIYLSSDDNVCFNSTPSTCSTPSLVHQNIIYEGRHYNYGSMGIYMDEQVATVMMTANVVYSVGGGGIYFHCGTDHWAVNNFLIGLNVQSTDGYIVTCNSGGNPTWPHLPQAFVWEKNIAYVSAGALTSPFQTDFRNTTFSTNVYFATHSGVLVFPHRANWTQWHGVQGRDQDSLVTDPLFADVEGHNFTLLPQSPALRIGVLPIDLYSPGPHQL